MESFQTPGTGRSETFKVSKRKISNDTIKNVSTVLNIEGEAIAQNQPMTKIKKEPVSFRVFKFAILLLLTGIAIHIILQI